MASTLQNEIQSKPNLRKTKPTIATPLRKAIQSKPSLRNTKPTLKTPLRKQIQSKPSLRITKLKMASILQHEIQSKPNLRKTKPTIATPLRKAIQSKLSLRNTKPTLKTPLRKQIQSKPSLRATRHKLATPMREAIQAKPHLKPKTIGMATLSSPLKKDIQSKLPLRQTKKRLPSPLQGEILSKPALRSNLRHVPTPLLREVRSRPALRSRALPAISSELKQQLNTGMTLRKTLPTAPTPFRKDIKRGVELKATKRAMRKSVQHDIKSFTQLKKTTRQSLKSSAKPKTKNVQRLKKLAQRKNIAVSGRRVLTAVRRLPRDQCTHTDGQVAAQPIPSTSVDDVSSPIKKRARRDSGPSLVLPSVGQFTLTASSPEHQQTGPEDDGRGNIELLLKSPGSKSIPLLSLNASNADISLHDTPHSANTASKSNRKSVRLGGIRNLFYVPKENFAEIAHLEGITRIFSIRPKDGESTVISNEVICADSLNRLFMQRKPSSPLRDFDGLSELFPSDTEDLSIVVDVEEVNSSAVTENECQNLIVEVAIIPDDTPEVTDVVQPPKVNKRSRRSCNTQVATRPTRVTRSCRTPGKALPQTIPEDTDKEATSSCKEASPAVASVQRGRHHARAEKIDEESTVTDVAMNNITVEAETTGSSEDSSAAEMSCSEVAVETEKHNTEIVVTEVESDSSQASVDVKRSRRNTRTTCRTKTAKDNTDYTLNKLPPRTTRNTITISLPAEPSLSSTEANTVNNTGSDASENASNTPLSLPSKKGKITTKSSTRAKMLPKSQQKENSSDVAEEPPANKRTRSSRRIGTATQDTENRVSCDVMGASAAKRALRSSKVEQDICNTEDVGKTVPQPSEGVSCESDIGFSDSSSDQVETHATSGKIATRSSRKAKSNATPAAVTEPALERSSASKAKCVTRARGVAESTAVHAEAEESKPKRKPRGAKVSSDTEQVLTRETRSSRRAAK